MKTFKSIIALTIAIIFMASCQSNQQPQTDQPSEVVQEDLASPETQVVEAPSKDYSYQLKLADNSMTYPYQQKDLGYGYNGLEPYIDKETMSLHYSKHHAGYTAKFNKAIEENKLDGMNLFELFGNISKYPDGVRNNGGGFYNHLLFWQVMAPNAGGEPGEALMGAITRDFGSYDAFKEQFSDAAKTVFGSGWAWLSLDKGGKLFISSTPNQDNPLMDVVNQRGIPILCLDVWEHAYYLKYQNKRPDYVGSFWMVINWAEVERRYTEAKGIL